MVTYTAITSKAETTTGASYLYGETPSGAVAKVNPVFVNAKDYGAVGDGAATENSALANAYAAGSNLFVPSGTYKISPEVDVATKDIRVQIDPSAKFTTAAWDMGNLARIIGANPVFAIDAIYKGFNTDYDLYEHAVGQSIFTEANTTGPTVVSLYSNCEVKVSGAYGFGANFGVYMTQTGGVGVGLEIDTHVTQPGTTTTALAIDSIGSYESTQAIIIQPNGPSSPFGIGINFNNASGNNAITTKAIRFTGAGTAQHFIYSPDDMTFTSAVLETNVFIVGPSVPLFDSLLRVDASASGSPKLSAVGSATNIGILVQTKGTGGVSFARGDSATCFRVAGGSGTATTYLEAAAGSGGATITARGSDTNADVILTGKGTAGVNILDGGGASKLRANTTGIGFNASTPIAKPAITGSRSGNAALANLLTQLANYGLITDSTTA